jgi:caffeoyl-CoA O-methyltransferase
MEWRRRSAITPGASEGKEILPAVQSNLQGSAKPMTIDNRRMQIADYIQHHFAPEDALLRELVQELPRHGLPQVQIDAAQGRLLQVLLTAIGARRVLELGTLGGYSAIWMARALPADGYLLSLEINPAHAEFARRYIERAGLARKVEIRIGAALDILPSLVTEAPFDLVFIDADKPPYPQYLDWALKLTRPGGIIAADNVLRPEALLDPAAAGTGRAQGIRAFNERITHDPRLLAIALADTTDTDGMSIAVVRPL